MLLTINQMLEQWRMRRFRHCLPTGDDTAEIYIDEPITGKVEKTMVDDWYENLLATAPAEMLISRNLANGEGFSVTVDNDGRRAVVELPNSCVRVLSIAYSDSGESIELTNRESNRARIAATSGFPIFGRGNSVGVLVSQHRLIVYGENLSEDSLEIIGVERPAEGFYELTALALATIEFDRSTTTVIYQNI